MALICPSCGEHNRDGAVVCGMCKAVLGRRPAYEATLGPARPLPPAPTPQVSPAPEAARRATSAAPPLAPISPTPHDPASPVLVFLDPPHAPGPDLEAIARALALQLADARMRAGLAIPTPVALTEDARAEALGAALASAGLRVATPGVNELVVQPFEDEVRAFALDAPGLAFRTTEHEGRFAWPDLRAAFLVSQSSFAVRRNRVEQANLEQARAHTDAAFRKLALGYRRGARYDAQRARALLDESRGTLTESTVLTLHLVARLDDGDDAHLVMTRGQLGYEGLGAYRGSGGQESWDALLARIAALAPHVVLDRRAERAPPRFPAIPGIGAAFGGKVPSAGWLHGAFLAWCAGRHGRRA